MTKEATTAETSTHEVAELNKGIEATRAEMSATMHALGNKLNPSELGEQAKVQIDHIEARAKEVLKEGLSEAKQLLQTEIAEAKTAVGDQLHQAKEMITEGLSEARHAVKKDIQEAIDTTKQSIRAATLGRVENFATQAGDVMNNTKDSLIDTVRQNPIPAALAGIGIAWLLMNRSSSSRQRSTRHSERDYGSRNGMGYGAYAAAGPGGQGGAFDGLAEGGSKAVHQIGNALGHAGSAVAGAAGSAGSAVAGAAHSAGSAVAGAAQSATDALRGAVGQGYDAAGRLVHGASDATAHMMHDATDAMGHLSDQAQQAAAAAAHSAREQAMRLERSLESTLDTHPLAIGAVAMAVGAAVGYSLPRTAKEDALMGEARDRLLHGATGFAHDAASSMQHLTEGAGESAKKALASATSATSATK